MKCIRDGGASNKFRIHSMVSYNGSRRKLLNASVDYARRNLYFIYEVAIAIAITITITATATATLLATRTLTWQR